MEPNNIDDPKAPPKDRDDDEEYVPGPLDEPSEAHDSNEPAEDLDVDEDIEILEDID